MKSDFSGYASKVGLKCTDGRTILAHAFKGNDGAKVPLLWNHLHDDPESILGHAYLEDRPDGVYAYGIFNNTPKAQAAKEALRNGDYDAMSIFANRLVHEGSNVVQGSIKEVSLVLSGANSGARIENVSIAHGDDVEELDDEAVIFTGLTLSHVEGGVIDKVEPKTEENPAAPTDDANADDATNDEGPTVQEILDGLTPEQLKAVEFVTSEALRFGANMADEEDKSDDETPNDPNASEEDENPVQHNDKDTDMTHNVFEKNSTDDKPGKTLSHSEMLEFTEKVLATAKKPNYTLKSSVLQHAAEYGIDNIEYLFPDAKLVGTQPEILSRQMEWVQEVIGKTKHSPFSRIRTIVADITAEEARAKGYVKGNLKKEEVLKLLRRKTEPTTIYKKQKLDRDDILDITDLDIVAWLKAEMLVMLNEEIARAILLGDGRSFSSDDKVDEERLRPIANDNPMYSHPVTIANDDTTEEIEEKIIRAQDAYRGSGNPVMFTTRTQLTDFLIRKDTLGRRIYNNVSEVADALLVSKIITVEPMEEYTGLIAIVVNLQDYVVGADKGGEVTTFEDFDIDYNQNKWLSETRISGALIRPKAALVFRKVGATEVTPTQPTFDVPTNKITFPSTAGVVYSVEGVDMDPGETLVITEDTQVDARPAANYRFPDGATNSWTFTFQA